MKLCSGISYFGPDKICYVANAAMLSHQKHGFCKGKSIVISNGYDFSSFQVDHQARKEIRKKLGISSDTVLFGVLGRLHFDKGQDMLLEAFSSLRNDKLKLALIGAGCTDANVAFADVVQRFGLKDSVKLLGNQSNIIPYLSALDIYIMPSRTEGFPNALAEAMAVGLPCIATNVGDAAVLANNFVLLTQPDSDSLAKAIDEMLQMTELQRQALGISAATWVRRAFSIDTIEQQYYQLYLQVLESY